MPLVRALAGPDGLDAVAEDFQLGEPSTVDFSRLRVIDIPKNGAFLHGISKEMHRARTRVVEHLVRLGARVERPNFKQLKNSFEIWGSMMHEAAETPFSVHMGDGTAVSPLRETLKFLVGKSDHTLPAVFLGLLEGVTDFPPGRAAKWRRVGLELRDQVHELLRDDASWSTPRIQ